jgi:hypothetical protein
VQVAVNRNVKELAKTTYEVRDSEWRQKIDILTSSAVASDQEQAKRLQHMQKAEALNLLLGNLRRWRMTRERQGVT